MSGIRPVIIDHRDSFTYNLAESVRKITGYLPEIIDFEQTAVFDLDAFSHIILSPGPGLPQEFSSIRHILRQYENTKKILGVCLGHQGIAHYYGGQLEQLAFPVHGQAVDVKVIREEDLLFKDVPLRFKAGYYHSWVVGELPGVLQLTAMDKNGNIAAFSHQTKSVFGIQFHPESFMTEAGIRILQNFLQ